MERKRRSMVKSSKAVDRVVRGLDDLWKICLATGFTHQERKAIADAVHAMRGVSGGWINDRKIR